MGCNNGMEVEPTPRVVVVEAAYVFHDEEQDKDRDSGIEGDSHGDGCFGHGWYVYCATLVLIILSTVGEWSRGQQESIL